MGVITKSPIIERDIDVLQQLEREASLSVAVSIPFHDAEIARAIEPGVATPRRRLQIVERLAGAGLRVGVNIAPIIPGLDEGVSRVLADAAQAGAHRRLCAARLPGPVEQVFEQRLRKPSPPGEEGAPSDQGPWEQDVRPAVPSPAAWRGQYAEAVAAHSARRRKVGLAPVMETRNDRRVPTCRPAISWDSSRVAGRGLPRAELALPDGAAALRHHRSLPPGRPSGTQEVETAHSAGNAGKRVSAGQHALDLRPGVGAPGLGVAEEELLLGREADCR